MMRLTILAVIGILYLAYAYAIIKEPVTVYVDNIDKGAIPIRYKNLTPIFENLKLVFSHSGY